MNKFENTFPYRISGFFQQINNPMLRDVNITYLNDTVDVESLVKPCDTDVLYEGGKIIKMRFINCHLLFDFVFVESTRPRYDAGSTVFQKKYSIQFKFSIKR